MRERSLAAACSKERREDLLGLHRLNVSAELNKIFPSTNMIENVIRNLRLATVSVKRWKTNGGSNMVSRWMAAGLIRAEQGFRRVHGYHRLGELAVALGRASAASPAGAQTHLEISRNLPYIYNYPFNHSF